MSHGSGAAQCSVLRRHQWTFFIMDKDPKKEFLSEKSMIRPNSSLRLEITYVREQLPSETQRTGGKKFFEELQRSRSELNQDSYF